MSNERKTPEKDPNVTQSYKALANERVPDHLNHKVLKMAAREGRGRYPVKKTWIRPMAWAATIGLSLAIVLEITQVPPMSTDPGRLAEPEVRRTTDDSPAEPVPLQAEETPGDARVDAPDVPPATASQGYEDASKDVFAPQDMAVLREAEEMARTQAGPNQPPVDAPAERAKTDPDNTAAEAIKAESVEKRSAATAISVPDASASTTRRAAGAALRHSKAGDALHAGSFAVADETKLPESDRPCPAALRKSAQSWLTCIAKLRGDGLDDLADYESREFERLYPKHSESAPDK